MRAAHCTVQYFNTHWTIYQYALDCTSIHYTLDYIYALDYISIQTRLHFNARCTSLSSNPLHCPPCYFPDHNDDEADHADDEVDHNDDEVDHAGDEVDQDDDEVDYDGDEVDHNNEEVDHHGLHC